MGLPRDPEGERKGTPFWNKPHEPMCDGCPGAWYRSPFAESLRIYLPTPGQNGSMESPLINSSAPRLVVEAVQLFKRYHANVGSWYMEVLHSG